MCFVVFKNSFSTIQFLGGSQTLIKVAEKYEKQKKLLLEAMMQKKHEHAAAMGPPASHYPTGHTRDRRFSDIGRDSGFPNSKSDRRHSDLTGYYYQYQMENQQPRNTRLQNDQPSKAANVPDLKSHDENKHFKEPEKAPPQKSLDGQSPRENLCQKLHVDVSSKNPLNRSDLYQTGCEKIDECSILSLGEKQKKASDDDKIDVDEDWSDAELENDEWCSFLDSQLEECVRHDMEVYSDERAGFFTHFFKH